MHPLQNGSQVTERPADKPVSGLPGYFADSGENNFPSYPGADWFNNVIDEFLNVLSYMGVVFDAQNTDNLKKAFEKVDLVSLSKAFNRSFIQISQGLIYEKYSDSGFLFSPHLTFGEHHYLPLEDIGSSSFTLDGNVVDNNDGTITVGSDQGDKIFSRITSQALTPNSLPFALVDVYKLAPEVDYSGAVRRAAMTGKAVLFSSGDYSMDYCQLSGGDIDSYGISHDHITILGLNGAKIISKSYVGDTPPPNLGLNYGFIASTFSLYNFKKVTIKHLSGYGPLFSNLGEDCKPITQGGGTYNAYNTVSKFISVNFSNDVHCEGIETEKYYGSVYYRECHDSFAINLKSSFSRQPFLFQDCDNLYGEKIRSYDARFSLEKASLDFADLKVFDRSTSSLIYTAVPGAVGDTEGVKLSGGYGIVAAGCFNATFRDCDSIRSGSEDFRTQNGPTGRLSLNVKWFNCNSYYSNRYALSTRSDTAQGTRYINCDVFYLNDINTYNQQPPVDVSEVLNPIVDGSTIESHWQFLLPRTSNAAMYSNGSGDEYRSCKVVTNPTMRVDDKAKLSERYADGFSAYGMQAGIQSFGTAKFSGNEFTGQCESNNGFWQFFSGDAEVIDNELGTGRGVDVNQTVPYCIGLRGSMSKLHLNKNYVKGGLYTIATQADNVLISDFKSGRNTFDCAGGGSIFRSARIDEYRLISYHDTFIGPALFSVSSNVARIQRILFDGPTILTDRFGISQPTEIDVLRLVLFKDGDEFYHRVDTSGNDYPQALVGPRTIKLLDVFRENAIYTATPGDDEGVVSTKFRGADISPSSAVDVCNLYASDGVTSHKLACTVAGGGTGQSRYLFNASNANVQGTFYLKYVPLNFDINLEF